MLLDAFEFETGEVVVDPDDNIGRVINAVRSKNGVKIYAVEFCDGSENAFFEGEIVRPVSAVLAERSRGS